MFEKRVIIKNLCWIIRSRPQTPETSLSFRHPVHSFLKLSDNVNNKCNDEADQVGASSAKLNVGHSAAATTTAATGGGWDRRG